MLVCVAKRQHQRKKFDFEQICATSKKIRKEQVSAPDLWGGSCVGVWFRKRGAWVRAPFEEWIFFAAVVSRVRVCVKVQPLLKGYKVRSGHDGEVTVQNLRQQGDENTDAGIGRRWKNYYFI